MGERVAWSREDIIIAYALYCITPLNQIRPSNKLIQQVAEKFAHSTSSLVMRMQNFAAIDPNSKVKGATHVAKLDRAIFDEFKHDWGALSIQAENLTGLALFDANPLNGAKPLSQRRMPSKTGSAESVTFSGHPSLRLMKTPAVSPECRFLPCLSPAILNPSGAAERPRNGQTQRMGCCSTHFTTRLSIKA